MAAQRFEGTLGGQALKLLVSPRISEANVGKMSAKDEELEREPHRTRTCNRLIKSQLLFQLS